MKIKYSVVLAVAAASIFLPEMVLAALSMGGSSFTVIREICTLNKYLFFCFILTIPITLGLWVTKRKIGKWVAIASAVFFLLCYSVVVYIGFIISDGNPDIFVSVFPACRYIDSFLM